MFFLLYNLNTYMLCIPHLTVSSSIPVNVTHWWFKRQWQSRYLSPMLDSQSVDLYSLLGWLHTVILFPQSRGICLVTRTTFPVIRSMDSLPQSWVITGHYTSPYYHPVGCQSNCLGAEVENCSSCWAECH